MHDGHLVDLNPERCQNIAVSIRDLSLYGVELSINE